jgi:exodeoxyribonuclease VII large subunit
VKKGVSRGKASGEVQGDLFGGPPAPPDAPDAAPPPEEAVAPAQAQAAAPGAGVRAAAAASEGRASGGAVGGADARAERGVAGRAVRREREAPPAAARAAQAVAAGGDAGAGASAGAQVQEFVAVPRGSAAGEGEEMARMRVRPGVEGGPAAQGGGALSGGEELFLPGRAAAASRPSGTGLPPGPGAAFGLPAGPERNGARPQGRQVVTVGELTRSIKGTLEGAFPRVLVKGEVSGFRGVHPRGHMFFSLKDADASIEVKVWASTAARLKFALRDGMSVVAEGSVDVYAPQGRYSLVVQRLEPDGEGALALAFQQLKERLAAEGLFGPLRTRAPRPLPFPPRRIGVVTSRSGAALQDFLRVLHTRHPRLSVLVCDARVQGEGAADDVVRALERLARTDVDVIVVTRGGGSVEDLWTFNEERVARAIFRSPVPVVSAIGHEVDFTISDFVADVRAPTPSAAAELLAPVLVELEGGLKAAEVRLRKAAERAVLEARGQLAEARLGLPDPQRLIGQGRLHLSALSERLARAAQAPLRTARERQRVLTERLHRQRPQSQVAQARAALTPLSERLQRALRERLRGDGQRLGQARLALERATPAARVQAERARLAALEARLRTAEARRLEAERARVGALAGRLEAMSPLRVMARGYAVAFRQPDGALVRHAGDVRVGDLLTVRLAGVDCREPADCEEVDARVVDVRPRPAPPGAGEARAGGLPVRGAEGTGGD